MQHAGPHELVIPKTGTHARRNGASMHNTRNFIYPSANSFILESETLAPNLHESPLHMK